MKKVNEPPDPLHFGSKTQNTRKLQGAWAYIEKKTEEKTEIKREKQERKEVMRKEEEKQELTVVRGEITPPTTPTTERQIGSGKRSPATAPARSQARLLEFHQECEKLRGLPPSRLQEEIREEERGYCLLPPHLG